MLRVIDREKVTPETRRKIEKTITSFFEFTAVDDTLLGSMYPEIQRLIKQHFRSFLRTSVSKADQLDLDLPSIAAAMVR